MDVNDWLWGISLARYVEMFRANDVDIELLGRLTNDDLKDIGVASLGHRAQASGKRGRMGTLTRCALDV